MKTSIIALTICTSLSVVAFAQTVAPLVLAPIVPTGKPRQVGFFAAINPDCSSSGDTDARIIKKPEHGEVELEQGSGFATATYKQDNPRYACNAKAVQGTRVKYTSKDGYIGKDAFEVEFLYSPAGDAIWKFAVTVK